MSPQSKAIVSHIQSVTNEVKRPTMISKLKASAVKAKRNVELSIDLCRWEAANDCECIKLEGGTPNYNLIFAKVLLGNAAYYARCSLMSVLFCNRFGHKIVDAGSYANGHSAAEHHRCTRCDREFSHTYY